MLRKSLLPRLTEASHLESVVYVFLEGRKNEEKFRIKS